MNKPRINILSAEICGVFFVLICSFFMSKLYGFCGGQLIGVMFGSVNSSVWESCKTLLLPYLLWGLIELLSISPRMKRFTSAKTVSLYFFGAVYISLSLSPLSSGNTSLPIKSACIALSFMLSSLLYYSKFRLEALFLPSVFLLFLFWAFYFSFTPFPPENAVFLDPATGRYGMIPDDIIKW